MGILNIITYIPAVGALVILFMSKTSTRTIRAFATATAVIDFLVSLWLWPNLSLDWHGRAVPIAALSDALLPMISAQTDAGGSSDNDYNGWSAYLSGNLGSGEQKGRRAGGG